MEHDRDWSILDVIVKNHSEITEVSLNDDLEISMDSISEDFCSQPALYAYWATLATQARSLMRTKKLEVSSKEEYIKKTLVGTLDGKVRAELELAGEKITESKVTNGIYAHPDYLQAVDELRAMQADLAECQDTVEYLQVAVEALNQRKDMLISLGAQMRQEIDNTDLTIKAQEIVGANRRRKPIQSKS